MKRFAAVAALAAAILSPAANAQSSWHLQLHTVSHHLNDRANGREWNENNAGIGVRRDFGPDWSAQVGAYRNSIDKTSAYALAEWTPLQVGQLSAGAFAGIRTNYTKPVQPAAGALVRWQGEQASITVRLSPKAGNTGSAVIALELGWKL